MALTNIFSCKLTMGLTSVSQVSAADTVISNYIAGQPAGSRYNFSYHKNDAGAIIATTMMKIVVIDNAAFNTKINQIYSNLGALPSVTNVQVNFVQEGLPE